MAWSWSFRLQTSAVAAANLVVFWVNQVINTQLLVSPHRTLTGRLNFRLRKISGTPPKKQNTDFQQIFQPLCAICHYCTTPSYQLLANYPLAPKDDRLGEGCYISGVFLRRALNDLFSYCNLHNTALRALQVLVNQRNSDAQRNSREPPRSARHELRYDSFELLFIIYWPVERPTH